MTSREERGANCLWEPGRAVAQGEGRSADRRPARAGRRLSRSPAGAGRAPGSLAPWGRQVQPALPERPGNLSPPKPGPGRRGGDDPAGRLVEAQVAGRERAGPPGRLLLLGRL